jgi:hypothetical protein
MLEVEAEHRRHTVVEQPIAEINSAGRGQAILGTVLRQRGLDRSAGMAHDLAPAISTLTSTELARATVATPPRTLFSVPETVARCASAAAAETRRLFCLDGCIARSARLRFGQLDLIRSLRIAHSSFADGLVD